MMRRRVHIHAYLLALVCAGCATLKAPPAPTMQTPEQFTARRLDDAGLQAFIRRFTGKPATTRWDLEQLTLAAMYFNPDLDVALADLKTSQAGEITASQRPNPTLGLTPTHDAGASHPWVLGLDVNLPIETAGKRGRRIEQARALASAAEYRLGTAIWLVRGRVVNALIDLATAQESIDAYHGQAVAQSAVLQVFSERAMHGQLPSVTASQMQIAYQQALLAENEAQAQAADTRVKLAAAIGMSVGALNDAALDFTGLNKSGVLVPGLHETLSRHTELMASLAEYRAAHAALELELAKQIPDVGLGPGYEWNRDGNKFTLGLSVTLPLFNRNEGPIAEAIARRRQAAGRFNARQAEIIGRLETAEAALQRAGVSLRTAERLRATQREKRARLQAQLRPGEVSRLPLLLAEAEIASAAVAGVQARAQGLHAKAALEEAAQVPQFGSAFDGHALQLPRDNPGP